MRFDIFCRIIDNMGDIGTCYRLAKILAIEHNIKVRLFIDDWNTACIFLQQACCSHIGLTRNLQLYPWLKSGDFASLNDLPDVVIEAFGCCLPNDYLQAMLISNFSGTWINLEYLSAEQWVEDYHGKASPHPTLPLLKYFFFPGFHANTGGLLRESNLERDRIAFCSNTQPKSYLLSQFGVNIPSPAARIFSLFTYNIQALVELLPVWAQEKKPVVLLIPNGTIVVELSQFLGCPLLSPGDSLQIGQLTIEVLSFLDQDHYDRLLWCCDINFVRGEDSFIRAHWAKKPFVWQIYPQDNSAHLVKLEAFLEKFCLESDEEARQAITNFWSSWNTYSITEPIKECWQNYIKHYPASICDSQRWVEKQLSLSSLVIKLLNFIKSV